MHIFKQPNDYYNDQKQIILSQPQINHKLTQTLGLTRKWLYTTTHPPTTTTTQTQCHQYLICSCSDFNQTLKVGFWDQQQQYYNNDMNNNNKNNDNNNNNKNN